MNTLYSFAHSTNSTVDRFADWETNKKNFTNTLTYGFSQIGTTTASMLVPKGAEVLLETRLPYLTANQRRWVLYTTGIASGYPLLDDTEGWGRLNLFAAADGYGALNGNVIVTMDATQGGFNATDSWRNDISGTGKLFKKGSGSLTLTGNNSYSGGTQIDAGTLIAASPSALGTGNVVLNGGSLINQASGGLTLPASFNQLSGSTMELDLDSNDQGTLSVSGVAGLAGTLNVVIGSGLAPVTGTTYTLLDAGAVNGQFTTVNVSGTSLTPTITYGTKSVQLTLK